MIALVRKAVKSAKPFPTFTDLDPVLPRWFWDCLRAAALVILFGIGLLFRLDLAEIAMASAVCIGGPSSAAALASAKGWRNLLIPGILAGSFGYAIGSFIGVTLVQWLQT